MITANHVTRRSILRNITATRAVMLALKQSDGMTMEQILMELEGQYHRVNILSGIESLKRLALVEETETGVLWWIGD